MPEETVLFEVLRTSDRLAGHNIPPTQPTEGAAFNKEENRWELEVKSLQQLISIAYENDAFLLLAFPTGAEDEDDLPIIEIQDAEEES